jgi:hypothetical protein
VCPTENACLVIQKNHYTAGLCPVVCVQVAFADVEDELLAWPIRQSGGKKDEKEKRRECCAVCTWRMQFELTGRSRRSSHLHSMPCMQARSRESVTRSFLRVLDVLTGTTCSGSGQGNKCSNSVEPLLLGAAVLSPDSVWKVPQSIEPRLHQISRRK